MRQMFAKGRSAKSANVSFFEGGRPRHGTFLPLSPIRDGPEKPRT